ncbi:MAG TPA: hypothetical protein VFD60_04995 [Nitrososphaeraceae archaeon]|nr:hypothetical protein [Nitrososphaeraceae archaeon]
MSLIIILFLITPMVFSNTAYAHIYSNITQVWTDRQNNIKIQFSYLPEHPTMDDLIHLQFSIQDLHTGKHLKNLIANVILVNRSFGAIYKLGNVAVTDGDFSIRCPSLDSGMHQVILKINSNSYSIASLASFNMSVLE